MEANRLTEGAAELAHWGVMKAVGEDASTFLQGQLSNDVQRLDAAHARLAAYCSAQGRMLASFVVVRPDVQTFWLTCSADLLAATHKRLSMFVLRAKVKLTLATDDWVVMGLAGHTAATVLGAQAGTADWDAAMWHGGSLIRLPQAQHTPRWLWIGPRTQAQAAAAGLPPLDTAQWDRLEVASGVGRIVAATAGQFVPQMLNFELVGGVDFKKGCYPGQEVVARSQYLGKLKRRAFLVDGPPTLAPGQEVFWSGDPAQPSGLVALAAPGATGAAALVELKVHAAASGMLRVGSADGPLLTLQPLPYAVPAEPEAVAR